MSSVEYLVITAIALATSAIALGLGMYYAFSQESAFNYGNARLFLSAIASDISAFSYLANGSYKIEELPSVSISFAIYCNNTLLIYPYKIAEHIGSAYISLPRSSIGTTNYLQFYRYKNNTLITSVGQQFFFYKIFYDKTTHTINYSVSTLNFTANYPMTATIYAYYPNMSLAYANSFTTPYNGSFANNSASYYFIFNNSEVFAPTCYP
jgi:hypothetical protein